MCEQDYQYFPVQSYGGPSGNYIAQIPLTSYQSAEYCVVMVTSGDTGPCALEVSGDSSTSHANYTSDKYDIDTFFRGLMFRLTATQTIVPSESWQRITDTQGRVFIHVSTPNSICCYAAIKFRAKPLRTIPAKTVLVHPDNEQQHNIARAEATQNRVIARENAHLLGKHKAGDRVHAK